MKEGGWYKISFTLFGTKNSDKAENFCYFDESLEVSFLNLDVWLKVQ